MPKSGSSNAAVWIGTLFFNQRKLTWKRLSSSKTPSCEPPPPCCDANCSSFLRENGHPLRPFAHHHAHSPARNMKVHLHQSLREICVPAYRINRIICDVNVLLSYLGTCSPSKMDDFFCDHTPEIVNGMTPAHSVKIKGSFLLDDSINTKKKKKR